MQDQLSSWKGTQGGTGIPEGTEDMPGKSLNEWNFYQKSPIKRNASIELYLTDSPEPSYYLIQEITMQRMKD